MSTVITREYNCGSYIFPIRCWVSDSLLFTAGGHRWAPFYSYRGQFIALKLSLDSNAKNVHAIVDITLLDKDAKPVGEELLLEPTKKLHFFSGSNRSICWERFIDRDKFRIFRTNNFVLCVIHITILRSDFSTPVELLAAPPSNLHEHLGKLLDDKERADVTFEVEGELFHAHGSILVARSTVFNAELSGPLRENCSLPIKIQDMKAEVFKAMLRFIYTDSVPVELEYENDDHHVSFGSTLFAQHLLVAADRYALDRLKWICENKLCSRIDTDMVATTLTLAEQHNSPRLKKLCFEFAAKRDNYIRMTFSDGYLHMVQSCPSIVEEFHKALTN